MPLRPLGLAELLDGAWQTMRYNPRVMFGLSAAVMAVTMILSTLLQLTWLSRFLVEMARLDDDAGLADDVGPAEALSPLLSGSLTGVVLPALLGLVAGSVLTGLLIVAVSDAVLGRTPDTGTVLHRVGRRGVGRLLLLTLLTTLAFAALVVAVAAPVVGLWFVSVPVGIVTTVVGLPLLVCAVAFLAVRLAFAAPALLLEELSPVAALRRSWRLGRGSGWRVLGVLLVAGIIGAIAQAVLSTPFSLGSQVWIAVGSGAADPSAQTLAGPMLLTGLGSIVSGAVVTPFTAAVTGLLYIDLRIRREGLDVALARAASATAPLAGS